MLQQLERAVAVVHAAGAQVVPPDRDLAEVDRQLELGVDVDRASAPSSYDLGVVHHDADGAVGHAVRAVLHLPLRVDPARLAVGLDDAVALRVAAGAARRLGVDHVARSSGWMRCDRLLERRRAGRRVDAPEAEHVAVPAALAGRDLALPDADAAELLRGVEQLGLAVRPARRGAGRVASVKVQSTPPARRRAGVDPERRVVGGRAGAARRRLGAARAATAGGERFARRARGGRACAPAQVVQAASPARPSSAGGGAASAHWPRRSCRRRRVTAISSRLCSTSASQHGRRVSGAGWGIAGRSWAAAKSATGGAPRARPGIQAVGDLQHQLAEVLAA